MSKIEIALQSFISILGLMKIIIMINPYIMIPLTIWLFIETVRFYIMKELLIVKIIKQFVKGRLPEVGEKYE